MTLVRTILTSALALQIFHLVSMARVVNRSSRERGEARIQALSPVEDAADLLRNAGKTRWTVIIYWARHGQSCANAMQDTGVVGRGMKRSFKDPVLTDCGAARSKVAGEKFARWAWSGVGVSEEGNIGVNQENLTIQHSGNDMYLGLDLIGSSSLIRAQETALFQFGRLASMGRRIFPLPYISEHGTTDDNMAATKEQQQLVWKQLTHAVPSGPQLGVGSIGRNFEMDWSAIERDYQYLEQDHKLGGKIREAGTGKDESAIAKFYAFLAENVLPTLAAHRVSTKTDELQVLRLGIASHSSFLLSVFKSVCGLDIRPYNNDVITVPYKFEIEDTGVHKLSILSEQASMLADFCDPTVAPVSRDRRDEDFRLDPIPAGNTLCKSEWSRCQAQIDLMKIRNVFSQPLSTGLPTKESACQCS